MKTNRLIYAIILASLVWVACDDDDDKVIDPTLNDTDELFVEKAARNNMAEIAFSDIALTKSTDSTVLQFAQKMKEEHTQAQNELKDIADDFRGIEFPNDLDEGHEALRAQLDSAAAGYSFDTLFLGTQVRVHEAARATFETATSTSSELRVRAYATKYLPYIVEHLETADSLHAAVVANGADSADNTDDTTDGTN